MKKPDVKSVLMKYAESVDDKEVAVLLSGGVDSASVMFSLLEAGKKVTAYSFMLDGVMSTDFFLARRNAEKFGCDFCAIFLPAEPEALQSDLIDLRNIGAQKKTDYECGWPMLHAYKQIQERAVFSGMGADGHFCISKKGMLHWRHRIDEFRNQLYTSKGYAQKPIHEQLAARNNKQAVMPYLSKEMQRQFLGTTWEQVNKPKQKQPILDAFPKEFKKIKVLPHTNLQLGDSKIAEHFKTLLATEWNKHGYVSVVGIYNLLNKREL
jgi:asparagine synthetase B (glutamine-hydrolysing)